MDKITLFHGSNTEVAIPRIFKPKRLLDFGAAFYTTSDYNQAKIWSELMTKRRQSGKPIVSVFEYDEAYSCNLNVLRFETAGVEWLKYVALNRTAGQPVNGFDIVIGPVADDRTIRTINDYLEGRFDEDIAIKLLKAEKLSDQYAFKTEDALKSLKYKGIIK